MNEWEKQWAWDENAPMHNNMQWIQETMAFPFYWYYTQHDGEVWYVKQIKKNCGVVQDWNYYGPKREKSAVARLAKRSVQKFTDKDVADYNTMKSWMTLGNSNEEPMESEVHLVRPNGGGYMMKFHPVTKKWIQNILVDENGEVFYRARMLVKQRSNEQDVWYEEHEYQNSLGDHFIKNWNDNKKKYEWQRL